MTPSERLKRSRLVLSGLGNHGLRTHPSALESDVVSLASGNGTRRPDAIVVGAGVAALLESGISSLERYFFGQTFPELDAEVIRTFKEEGLSGAALEAVCVASGTAPIFCGFLHSVLQPGSTVLVGRGYYHSLAAWCEITGVHLECVHTDRMNGYKLTACDLDRWYCAEATNRAASPKGIVIFNPTYTGAVYTPDELRELAERIEKYNLLCLEDCIFSDTRFRLDCAANHIGGWAPAAHRTLTVSGGSKAYGLANMRIGWACGSHPLVTNVQAYVSATAGTVPHVAKTMALAALRNRTSHIECNSRENAARCVLLVEYIEQVNRMLLQDFPSLECHPVMQIEHVPEAGHCILVSFDSILGYDTPTGSRLIDSVDLTEFLLRSARVAVSPGLSLGFDGLVVRMSFNSIGTSALYAWQREQEKSAIRTIVGRSGTTGERRVDLLDGCEQRLDFDKGRKILQNTMIHRIHLALDELLRCNLGATKDHFCDVLAHVFERIL